jgi:drug/metabolite transporter (DMT)-like permease
MQVRARLQILAAAVLWSTSGAAIKLTGLSGWQVAGGRSLCAAAFILVAFRSARARPDRRVLLAGAAYAATVVLFAVANKLTTSASAIFVQDIAPLWVVLLSPLLLRERPTRSELLSIPLYGAGLVLFFVDELSPGQVTGNLVALGSGFAFAFCIVGLRGVGRGAIAAVAWGNLMAAAVALPLWTAGPAATPRDLALLAYLGVFQLGLAYVLFARGVEHTPAVEASLLCLLEPVLNPIWAFLFAGERPGPWAMAGGAIVLGVTAVRTLRTAVAPPSLSSSSRG